MGVTFFFHWLSLYCIIVVEKKIISYYIIFRHIKTSAPIPLLYCIYSKMLGMGQIIFHLLWHHLLARSQNSISGCARHDLGSQAVSSGAGFCEQNLKIKYVPCIGTHLCLTVPAKSALSNRPFHTEIRKFGNIQCVNHSEKGYYLYASTLVGASTTMTTPRVWHSITHRIVGASRLIYYLLRSKQLPRFCEKFVFYRKTSIWKCLYQIYLCEWKIINIHYS